MLAPLLPNRVPGEDVSTFGRRGSMAYTVSLEASARSKGALQQKLDAVPREWGRMLPTRVVTLGQILEPHEFFLLGLLTV